MIYRQNFLRLIFCLIIFSTLIAPLPYQPPLSASLTRSAGLGLDRDTAWMKRNQLPYIFENPAAMVGFKNYMHFEDFNGQQTGGIFIPFPAQLTVGIFSGTTVNESVFNNSEFQGLFHPGAGDPAGIDFTNAPDAPPPELVPEYDKIDDATANELVNRNIEFMASRIVAGYRIGFSFSYGFATQNDIIKETQQGEGTDRDEVNLNKSEYSGRLGVLKNFNNGVLDEVGGSLFLTKYVIDNYYEQGAESAANNPRIEYTTDGALDFGFTSRLAKNTGANSRLHLHLAYARLDRSTRSERVNFGSSDPDAKGTYSRKGHEIRAGGAHDWRFSERLSIFWGGEFNYQVFDNNYEARIIDDPANANPYKVSFYSIEAPVILGLQASISESWEGRLGVRHNAVNSGDNFKQTEETLDPQGNVQSSTVTSQTEFLSAGSNLSTGLSYLSKNLSFDWLVNVAMFKEGPFFISGNQNDFSTAFSITFRFGDLY